MNDIEITRILKKGEDEFSRGNMEIAASCFRKILTANPSDKNALNNLGVVSYRKGELEEALSYFVTVLEIDAKHLDAIENIARIKETKGEFLEALQWFQKALRMGGLTVDTLNSIANCFIQLNDLATARKVLNESLQMDNNQESVRNILGGLDKAPTDARRRTRMSGRRRKLIFFTKQGMQTFIESIVETLAKEFETKLVIVSDLKEIEPWMRWADICWFEWCDELIGYGSKLQLAQKRKIICRLHSYEAFTQYIADVAWENVSCVVFVAEHIRNFVLEKQKNLPPERTVVIPNGIDVHKYAYKERSPGFKIAHVGYINYKKGPMLLLHTFKAIYDKDSRYTLHIAGVFQDPRDTLYFAKMIQKLGLQNNVFYEGWQDNIDHWLEDKYYFLCTSILESQNLSVMQAMCKGIKPLVHNFVGADGVYPDKYVWNSIDQAVKMIQDVEYNSAEYHNFIKNNYLFEDRLNDIKKIIISFAEQAEESAGLSMQPHRGKLLPT